MQCLICKYAVLSKMQECMNYFESTAWGASMQFGQWCKIAERPKMQEWSTDLDASVQSAVWPKMQECRVQCGQRCKRAECSVAKDARMHPCQRCKRAVQCGLSCKNASLSCLPTSDGASPPPLSACCWNFLREFLWWCRIQMWRGSSSWSQQYFIF